MRSGLPTRQLVVVTLLRTELVFVVEWGITCDVCDDEIPFGHLAASAAPTGGPDLAHPDCAEADVEARE